MKKLTVAFDVMINDQEDYLPESMVVQVDETCWRQHEGFTPVIITEGLSFTDKPVKFDNETIYFSSDSFKELR